MGGLIGGSAPAAPKPQPPAPMPDDQSPAVLEARRQKMLAAGLRQGRDSTFMADTAARASSGGTIAGGDYTRRSLGGS